MRTEQTEILVAPRINQSHHYCLWFSDRRHEDCNDPALPGGGCICQALEVLPSPSCWHRYRLFRREFRTGSEKWHFRHHPGSTKRSQCWRTYSDHYLSILPVFEESLPIYKFPSHLASIGYEQVDVNRSCDLHWCQRTIMRSVKCTPYHGLFTVFRASPPMEAFRWTMLPAPSPRASDPAELISSLTTRPTATSLVGLASEGSSEIRRLLREPTTALAATTPACPSVPELITLLGGSSDRTSTNYHVGNVMHNKELNLLLSVSRLNFFLLLCELVTEGGSVTSLLLDDDREPVQIRPQLLQVRYRLRRINIKYEAMTNEKLAENWKSPSRNFTPVLLRWVSFLFFICGRRTPTPGYPHEDYPKAGS